MASQQNRRNAGEQDPAKINNAILPSFVSLTWQSNNNHIGNAFYRVRAQLCECEKIVIATVKKVFKALKKEQKRSRDYYDTYKSMKSKNESMINDMHGLANANFSLHQDLKKICGILNGGQRQIIKFQTISDNLASRNLILQQNVKHARNNAHISESRVVADVSPSDTTNTDKITVHELISD